MSTSQIAAGSLRPPITTTDQPVPLITTTTLAAPPTPSTTSASSSVHPTPTSTTATRPGPVPTLQSRTPGWHARSFGFDWDKPAERHRYQLKTGLPLVHAAMMNGDWDHALSLMTPDDLGLIWVVPASQRMPNGTLSAPHASRWASQLPSVNPERRQRAIIEMAIDLVGLTSVDYRSLHGANLLSLCLLLKVPSPVLKEVLAMAGAHAPQYLRLPDANGRTPLTVAAQCGVPEHVEMLLLAGAHPLDASGSKPGHGYRNAIEAAASEAGLEIYMKMLGALSLMWRKDGAYPYAQDPARLQTWLARHGADDAVALAKRFPSLNGALLCFKDSSGQSRMSRMIMDGTLSQLLPPGLHAQVRWYRMQQVALQALQGTASSPLVTAAQYGPTSVFFSLMAYAEEGLLPAGDDDDDSDVGGDDNEDDDVAIRHSPAARTHSPAPESDVEVSSASSTEADSGVNSDASDGWEDWENWNPAPAKLLLTQVQVTALQRFVECRSARDIEKLQLTLPRIGPSLAEGAFLAASAATRTAVETQLLSEDYRALMRRICTLLSSAQKMELIMLSTTGASAHMCFLLGLPDFPHGQQNLYEALVAASWSHNREAFEIAAGRSWLYRNKPKTIDSALPLTESSFDHEFLALKAGSALWFQRFMKAGLDLHAMLRTLGPRLLPLIADVDPDLLPSLRNEIVVKIDEHMVVAARTEEGRQALRALRDAAADH